MTRCRFPHKRSLPGCLAEYLEQAINLCIPGLEGLISNCLEVSFMDPARRITPSAAERKLIRAAVATSCLLGLAFGLTRLLSVFRADLKESALSLPELLLVVMIFASVALLIVIACAALGFLVGAILSAVMRIGGFGPRTKQA
jgi:hypothetical protein